MVEGLVWRKTSLNPNKLTGSRAVKEMWEADWNGCHCSLVIRNNGSAKSYYGDGTTGYEEDDWDNYQTAVSYYEKEIGYAGSVARS